MIGSRRLRKGAKMSLTKFGPLGDHSLANGGRRMRNDPDSIDSAPSNQLFDNLPELITTKMVAEVLHTSRATVFQWHSRPRRYRVPEGLFIKFGRRLLIRRDVLKTWVLSRCSKTT